MKAPTLVGSSACVGAAEARQVRREMVAMRLVRLIENCMIS